MSKTSLKKDTEDKRLVYAEAGIAEYWVVNLRDGGVILYRDAAEGNYRSEIELTSGGIFPLAFPDVVIEVDSLLV